MEGGSSWRRFGSDFARNFRQQYAQSRFTYWFMGLAGLVAGPFLLLSVAFGWSDFESQTWAVVFGVLFTILDLFFIRFLIRNRHVVHDAAVCYATPEGKDPYYFAMCECGWFDGPADRDVLFTAARKHTGNVRPEVETRSD